MKILPKKGQKKKQSAVQAKTGTTGTVANIPKYASKGSRQAKNNSADSNAPKTSSLNRNRMLNFDLFCLKFLSQ